jgi:hypothetical protein
MLTGVSTTIGPSLGSQIDASKIIFYIAGTDGPILGLVKAAFVGPLSTVVANFYVKNGTLWITAGSQATGAFLAKDVIIGAATQLNLATAFSGLLKAPAENNEALPTPDLPVTYSLDQNYPNPFNPATTIRYQLPQDGQVRLDIFNVLGQLVRTLVDEPEQAGFYTIKWDGTNGEGLSAGSGVYFYRIQAGDFVQSRKMMVLK